MIMGENLAAPPENQPKFEDLEKLAADFQEQLERSTLLGSDRVVDRLNNALKRLKKQPIRELKFDLPLLATILDYYSDIESGYYYRADTQKEREGAAHERVRLLEIALRNPELAWRIIEQKVIGVHASTAPSLVGVQEHGLRPQNWLTEHNVPTLSGEKYELSPFATYNTFNAKNVSFFPIGELHDLSHYVKNSPPRTKKQMVAVNKETIHRLQEQSKTITHDSGKVERMIDNLRQANATLLRPQGPKEELLVLLSQEHFPVVYLVSGKNKEGVRPKSDLTEFGFEDGVPAESIEVVLVPSQYVSFVKKMFQEQDTMVASIEDYFGSSSHLYTYENKKVHYLKSERTTTFQRVRAALGRKFPTFFGMPKTSQQN
jgi:hypothetical protein